MISAAGGEKLSLLSIFERECRNSASFPAFVFHADSGGSSARTATTSLSYSDTWTVVEEHRAWLQRIFAKMSIGEDDVRDVVIAYLSSNSVDFLLSMMASTSCSSLVPPNAHCVAALLNIRWTPAEMAKALQSQNPHQSKTIILYGDGFAKVASDIILEGLGHTCLCFPLPTFSGKYLKSMESPKKVALVSTVDTRRFGIDELEKEGDDRDAVIVFTSGTTGGSKGVRLSHRAIAIQSMAKLADPCCYSRETAMLASTVPLFHIGGISSCLAVLFCGGSLVFPWAPGGGFDPIVVKASLGNPVLPINTLVVVPAMLVALLAQMNYLSVYPAVRLVLIGGQSASKSTIDKLVRMFPNAAVVQTYACTEAASSLTFLRVTANNAARQTITKRPDLPNGDCVGAPPPHIHLRLHSREGKATKIVTIPYQVGIIATRGSHLMNGYWSRGSLDPPFNISGWYLTSDLGFFDDNKQLHFCGRVKDVIRSGGETIHALEVERVLLQHPEVAECAVFARQDVRFGEAVACAIVAKEGSLIKLAGIKEWCQKQGLASYKRPRYLFQIESLPRNTSGKVLKQKLIQSFGRIRSKL